MFSILHISDLHRSPDEPIDNDALIAALLNDRNRYMGETPVVPSPDAIVVSGDVIQGVRRGTPDWGTSLRQQYDVATEFLDHLVRRFLDGDRSRLILVPGNHDVCWNTSFGAMQRVAEGDYPKSIPAALAEPDSMYRWSWEERALYKIVDQNAYVRRLDWYWDFVERFYQGVPLALPIDRTRGFHFFELDSRRIVVAAFESVHGNDCFAYSGALPRGAIGRCYLALHDLPRTHQLRIGVWHHSVQGPPMHEDYLDIGQVHEMAGHGLQLGLHGHQHVAAAATHYVHLAESQAMAVVSAGSLCAGSRELPRGVNRQYNIIVVDDDYRRVRVHVREMTDGGHFTRKGGGGFAQGYVELTVQPPVDMAGREIDVALENEQRSTRAAEKALHSGNPIAALDILESIPLRPGAHTRQLFFEAARRAGDWKRLIAFGGTPQSANEAVLLVKANEEIGDFDCADAILAQHDEIDAITRRELRNRLEVRRMMRGK